MRIQQNDRCSRTFLQHTEQHTIIRSHLALDWLTEYQNSQYKNDLSENIFTIQSWILSPFLAMINHGIRL